MTFRRGDMVVVGPAGGWAMVPGHAYRVENVVWGSLSEEWTVLLSVGNVPFSAVRRVETASSEVGADGAVELVEVAS